MSIINLVHTVKLSKYKSLDIISSDIPSLNVPRRDDLSKQWISEVSFLYIILLIPFDDRWFQQLCEHFKVRGHSYYFYKPVGRRRTVGIKPPMALEKLQEGLKDANMAFIYHCHNHYFCPIGFEEVPKKATDAYR